MPKPYVLDTNMAIASMNGNTAVNQLLREQAALIYIPSIVLGELYFGAEKSSRVQENLKRVEAFQTQSIVLVCDQDTARIYGTINGQLRRKGRPIPSNDVRIAATAKQHNLTVLTRDHHFDEIDGLLVEKWQA